MGAVVHLAEELWGDGLLTFWWGVDVIVCLQEGAD